MTYEHFYIGTLCLTMAGVVMYAARHWLQPRKKGESIAEFAQRVAADRKTYKEAKKALMNSRVKLGNALFSNAMLLGLMWLMVHAPYVCWIAVGYVVIGATLAVRLLTRPPGWEIITVLDRLLWRIEHAWFWPLLVLRNIRKLKEV